jgi:hypothetical protein
MVMAWAFSTVPEILRGLMVVLNFDYLISIIRTGAIFVLILIIIFAIIIGCFPTGPTLRHTSAALTSMFKR